MNIGVIGAGAIANFLFKEINKNKIENVQITSVLVRDKKKYQTLETKFGVALYTDLDAFLDSDVDVVVEAANIEAVKSLVPEVIKKKDAVLISIGALADEIFLQEITELSETHRHKVHLPSGAIGGLDLIQNANALGALTSVTLTTRKPAGSLTDELLTEAMTIFSGKAADAIKQYPKNVNVSIVLSLAGMGIEDTKMNLIADPAVDKNIHQIDAKGDFGEACFTITNNPLPDNPKTSYLASMSILGTLTRIGGNIRIGE